MIGIIAAMSIEMELITAEMESPKTQTVSGITFTKGTIENQEVVCAVCGVGKVFAAMCAQTMILLYHPNAIINTGVAGSLSNELNIGDIAISDFVVEHDMDTSPLGDPIGMISGINIINIPADKDLYESVKMAAEQIDNIKVVLGTIASGDCFVNEQSKKDFITKNFNAISCEMEGAAIGHVCYVNKVPFCVVRSVSDKADGSSHMDFPAFAKMAAKSSSAVIKNFLKLQK